MKKIVYFLLLLSVSFSFAQKEDQRIQNIKHQLDALSVNTVGLTENVKTEIQVTDITLSNFLLGLSEIHKVNINVDPNLNQQIKNNFTNVTVADLLVFLCKEYNLTIDFTGNILSIKKYIEIPKQQKERVIPVSYTPSNSNISLDVKGDKLYDVFKRIMDVTGKNLVFSPGLGNESLTAYIQETPFDAAMDKLAFANNLYLEKTKDGFYLFEGTNTNVANGSVSPTSSSQQRPVRRRKSNFFFKVINPETKLLEVDFTNTPIGDIINDIGNELKIDIFTATPLDKAGNASFKAKSIHFDDLLVKLFESQGTSNITPNGGKAQKSTNSSQRTGLSPSGGNASNNNEGIFTFKKENNIYYFGTEKQLSVRNVEIVYLQYRSVELLDDPSGGNSRQRNFNNNRGGSFNSYNNFSSSSNSFNRNSGQINSSRNPQTSSGTTSKSSGESKSLLSIVPEEIKEGLDFNTDYELNSFYITGPSAKIERFKAFINKIDKPVPVVLIEVMIIEVSRSSTVETGIDWGIGDAPTTTQGGIFPEANIKLGATTINKIIGGFDSFGGFNLGKVVPNFFANIKAMEANGNFKILSTPKLATLNGHRATFSNGQTTYYGVTQRDVFGSDNPQVSEITNYFPIEAELGLTIKPSVSGNGQILLDINVIQSSFGGRIDPDAPPNLISRTFTSIIRMQDQDIAILGGLEENSKENSGNGVPFLARIPIIKYLFSKRKREAKKSKLSVLIKPTVIY
ncbi:type II secretion system protein GspD [Pontimicrobium sp. MEBiC01747]